MELNESIVFAGGRFARYDEAKVGLLTHGLNYGTGCFEGIRGYWNPDDRELYLLQLREHFERLHASAKILLMTLPPHGRRTRRLDGRTLRPESL